MDWVANLARPPELGVVLEEEGQRMERMKERNEKKKGEKKGGCPLVSHTNSTC